MIISGDYGQHIIVVFSIISTSVGQKVICILFCTFDRIWVNKINLTIFSLLIYRVIIFNERTLHSK